MRKYQLIASGAALALMAGACQSASTPSVQEIPSQSDLQPATEAPALAQEAEAQAPTSEAVAPVDIESAAPVAVRLELAATNPAAVNLANGSPTFVEFFAFW